MVVCPGGGYRTLMMSYEGVDIAQYLNTLGVHAFVLKYRLTHQGDSANQEGKDVRELAGEDGQQAIRLVRRGAADMGIKPNQIGMIGFSAGGGVTLSSVFGPADGRPDFVVPVYTGGGLSADSIEVPENAPPLCIFTAANDQIIPWGAPWIYSSPGSRPVSWQSFISFKRAVTVSWKKGVGQTTLWTACRSGCK